jgi:hypothetical protein
LLRSADNLIGLTKSASKFFEDNRRSASSLHSVLSMFAQRVYGIALGYEDLNDHDSLRWDMALQTFVGKDSNLASSATLSRFENSMTKEAVYDLHSVLVDTFIASYKKAPKEIILDFDTTDDLVHGRQEGSFFNKYYDHTCFQPLYVFAGQHLLCAQLRPGNMVGAKHALAILGLLVKRIRKSWPKTKIIFRGDSAFCRWRLMRWCERRDIGYIIALNSYATVSRKTKTFLDEVKKQFAKTGEKQTSYKEITYAAGSWDKERRVIVKSECRSNASMQHQVLTNLKSKPKAIYQKYCGRGEAENRIKEQLLLFSDRTSASKWLPNQLRILLSAYAYTLLLAIRRLGLRAYP